MVFTDLVKTNGTHQSNNSHTTLDAHNINNL